MFNSFFKNHYFLYGIIGSLCFHIALFFLSSVQNRRQFQENFIINLPKKNEHARIYFTSVTRPQIKEEKPNAPSTSKEKVKFNPKAQPPKTTKKEVIKKEVAKKEKEKKPKEKIIPEKKAEPQKVEKPTSQKIKKGNKKIEEAPKQTPQKQIIEPKQEPLPIKTTSQTTSATLEQRKKDLFFSLAQALKKEVALHWIPPMTDKKGLSARVKCTVSPKGKIEQVVLIESSQVIAYDMSVVRAAWKLSTEKPLWGTQFLIAFNQ